MANLCESHVSSAFSSLTERRNHPSQMDELACSHSLEAAKLELQVLTAKAVLSLFCMETWRPSYPFPPFPVELDWGKGAHRGSHRNPGLNGNWGYLRLGVGGEWGLDVASPERGWRGGKNLDMAQDISCQAKQRCWKSMLVIVFWGLFLQ